LHDVFAFAAAFRAEKEYETASPRIVEAITTMVLELTFKPDETYRRISSPQYARLSLSRRRKFAADDLSHSRVRAELRGNGSSGKNHEILCMGMRVVAPKLNMS
jgi:hypothetical protein